MTEGGPLQSLPTAAPTVLGGRLAAWAERVHRHLPGLLPPPTARPEPVHQAMHYALTGAGKRVRPVLTLAVADLFGVRSEPVLDLACAVEMVHACSLVLDDLPAMDDAALRRGRPTVHRAFGESVALLAALGLLNRAYALVAAAAHRLSLRRYTTDDVVHHLAKPEEMNLDGLEYIHSHKTGALFMAAGELGAMAADAKRKDLEVIARYAKNLGLAFQIADDLLDVLGTPEVTGKDTGKDEGKVTFVRLLGVEGAQSLAAELLGFAVDSLAPLGRKAEPLRELAVFVQHRSR